MPNNRIGRTITDQIIRSSTSVAANYRAVCRAKSKKDFIYKMKIVIEEADETLFWLEMIEELDLINNKLSKDCIEQIKTKELLIEANELVAIFVASAKTVEKQLK